MAEYWRLLRDKDSSPATLFHGVQGSRILPLDEWVDADVRRVDDGGTPYQSGFHVVPMYAELLRVASRFRNIDDVVVCLVDVAGDVWEKEHSPYAVLLAERMRVRFSRWAARQRLRDARASSCLPATRARAAR